MIKALASDRADQSLRMPVLPWRSRRCRSVANAHRSDAARKCLAIDAVPITDEIVWCALPTTCLLDLLGDPFGTRVRSDAENEARYAAFLKSRTAADLARRDEITGILCSTDGRLPGHAIARLAELRSSSIGGANPWKQHSQTHSITSSARNRTDGGISDPGPWRP